MSDELKMINVKGLPNHPEHLENLEGRYRTIFGVGQSPSNDDLERTMNILASKGWRPVAMSAVSSPGFHLIYVIMEKMSEKEVKSQ